MAAVVIACLAVLPAATAAASSRHDVRTAGLELFVHPRGGGGWSARPAVGVEAGLGAPSVAATRGGVLVIAGRTPTGDVTVAEGGLSGAFSTTDLTTALGAPPAAGRPVAAVSPSGTVTVWYRTTSGDLEVATQRSRLGRFTALDVTASTGSTTLLGDPTVFATRTGDVGYAVSMLGTVVEFVAPGTPTSTWTVADPTNGLAYPPLTGSVTAFRAPGLPAATVLLAVARSGDVIELSDELVGRPDVVGPWAESDLTAEGAPAATGPIEATGGWDPDAAYTTWGGDVVALMLVNGLVGGFATEDLTRASDLVGALGAEPQVIGGSVAERSATGSLLLASIAAPTVVSDVSFLPHTAELVAGDAAGAVVAGEPVLVAEDGGPIARTPLERRIALIATAYDQQHRGFQTDPHGSYCNPFTASFGRGWTSGCRAGFAAEEWCSDFAQWVWRAAGIPTRGITGWSATFVTWGVKHHRARLGTNVRARVGDAIVWGQRSPLYGQHVAIVVAVRGRYLDVVSGDSGGDFPGYGIGVWRWGPFIGSTSTVLGYHVLAVVRP